MSVLNLDRRAAQIAHDVIKYVSEETAPGDSMAALERTATRTLGVLQEDGLYAAVLFLLSRSGSKPSLKQVEKAEPYAAVVLAAGMLQLLLDQNLFKLSGVQPVQGVNNEEPGWVNGKKAAILKWLADDNGVAGDLPRLLMAKTLMERVLIYTRYGAKALQPEAESR